MNENRRRWEHVPGVRYPEEPPQPPPGWLSCREVARLLGCSKSLVRWRLRSVAKCTPSGLYFAPEDVLPLRSAGPGIPPRGYCSSKEAAERFGVRKTMLGRLAAAGLVRVVLGKGRRGAFCYWYRVADLARYVSLRRRGQ